MAHEVTLIPGHGRRLEKAVAGIVSEGAEAVYALKAVAICKKLTG